MLGALLAITLVQPRPLTIGSPAPPLQIAEWIRGPAVSRFAPGKVYVIDFWAVWCGPCVAAMPHLTALQKRFGDKIEVVGVVGPDDYGDTLDAVRSLVKRKGASIGYRIGWDKDASDTYLKIFRSKTILAYMKQASVESFPIGFVIDQKGRIAYIGHPGAIDPVVADVVAGRWSLAEAARRRNGQLEAEIRLKKFSALLKGGKCESAYDLARQIAAGPAQYDPRLMTMIASEIAGYDDYPAERDLALAETCAKTAVRLTDGADSGILDCLASVYFRKGELDKAIETEKKAIALSEGDFRAAQQKNLDRYLRAKGTAAGSRG